MATIAPKLGTLVMGEMLTAFGTQQASRLNEQSVARRHGAYLADVPLLDKGVIRIEGAIVGTSVDDAKAALLEAANAFNTLGNQRFYYWSDSFWVVSKATWNWEPVGGSPGLVYKFQAELHANDPFMYEDDTESDTQEPDGSDLTFTLNNEGLYDGYLRTTFTANKGLAITACSLQNLTSGKTFGYIGTVAIGNALLINPMGTVGATVTNNGTEDLTNVTGTWPVLLLPGANTLKYVGTACTLLNEWRNRWST